MTLQPESTGYDQLFESDLTQLPGWRNSDEETQRRILNSAKEFILKHDPGVDPWPIKKEYPLKDLAGFKAFRLIWKIEPDRIENYESAIWKKWISYLLWYFTDNEEAKRDEGLFFKIAYQKIPDELIANLLVYIDKENERGHINCIPKVAKCWDEKLENAVATKLIQTGDLKPEVIESLLESLLNQNNPKARDFAVSLATSWDPMDQLSKDRAFVGGQSLFKYAPDAGWPLLWPVIIEHEDFGKELFLTISHFYLDPAKLLLSKLTEDQLKE